MTKEERRVYFAKWKAENKDKIANYNTKNKDKIKAARDKHRAKNKDMIKAQAARSRANRKDKIKAEAASYYVKNKDKIKAQVAKYQTNKRINGCPIYSMKIRVRRRLLHAFKAAGLRKNTRTEKMLGCTFKQFTNHIEKQFADGMSWDNRGEWHLDHIVPLSCATTIEGLEKLSHYKNIRPLWATDNRAKSDNLVLI